MLNVHLIGQLHIIHQMILNFLLQIVGPRETFVLQQIFHQNLLQMFGDKIDSDLFCPRTFFAPVQHFFAA